jgi:hypothetical protein
MILCTDEAILYRKASWVYEVGRKREGWRERDADWLRRRGG